jgi:Rod binding domain-containing protein
MAVAPTNGIGYDAKSLGALRSTAVRDPKAAVKEAARSSSSRCSCSS